MARKPRMELEGGLYHVFTRGNNRQLIFNSDEDYIKFRLLLAKQKARLPFYLYAYCLMPNHVHLLMERRDDDISNVMQRLLTSFSQYHNRRHQKVGHVFQGRYKAILCQADQYLAELVRYIHLNPVRAGIVRRPEEYVYSGHREYLGLDETGLVDTDALLRYFGARKKTARLMYEQFVRAGIRDGHREDLYEAEEGRLLGSEEFVEETMHRVGEIPRGARPKRLMTKEMEEELDCDELMRAVEMISGVARSEFCSGTRSRQSVEVREALLLTAIRKGISQAVLNKMLGLEVSVISRRVTAARRKMQESKSFSLMVSHIEKALTRKE